MAIKYLEMDHSYKFEEKEGISFQKKEKFKMFYTKFTQLLDKITETIRVH